MDFFRCAFRPSTKTTVVVASIFFCFNFMGGLPVFAATQVTSPEIKIRYLGPGSIEGEDTRNIYNVELLQRALARSGKNYTFERGTRGLSRLRQLYEVVNGTVDVGWTLSTVESENILIPIPIPIDKGLIGWRIFLINKGDEKIFADVKTIDDLRSIRLGQGQDWADTLILRANKFTVEGVSTYDGIFKMLKQKRVRYFPRSILEIWGELSQHREMDLAIEQTISIHYPAALYFIVSLDKQELASEIEAGLEAMIKDGEFDRIFNKYHAERIKNANIGNRRVFKLKNSYSPSWAPVNRPELWFDIKK